MNDISGTALRQPPADMRAEQAFLGALLANNKVLDVVGDFLRPEHFVDPVHGRIYEMAARRIEAGGVADVVTLRTQLEGEGTLAEVGGAHYLASLLGAMVGIINAREYGRVIFEHWQRRRLIAIGTDIVNNAFGVEDIPTPQLIPMAEDALYRLGMGQAESRVFSLDQAMEDCLRATEAAMQRTGGLTGLPTGLAGYDKRTGGLQRSELTILAGRPSMGKTALGVRMALGAAHAGASVYIVSAEMPAAALSARILAAEAGMQLPAVLRGYRPDPENPGRLRRLSQAEFDRLVQAKARLRSLRLTIEEASAPSIAEIRAKARRLKRRQGLDLVLVDYLGKLRASNQAAGQNRVQEVSEIARDSKAMAVELDVPVLMLAQLSRAVEQRDDKTPVMADLRDSGEIEQEADVIGLLYRAEYYLQKAEPQRRPGENDEKFAARCDVWRTELMKARGRADLIIGKLRQGATGRVPLAFDGSRTWFSDLNDGASGATDGDD